CRQHVRVGSDGLVETIQHEEIPGERERLHQFEAEAAPRTVVAVAPPITEAMFPPAPANDTLVPRMPAHPSLAAQIPTGANVRAGQELLIGHVMVLLAILLFWAPCIGLGLAVLAVVTNIGVRGWPRTLAWISIGLSVAATAVFVMVTAALVMFSGRPPSLAG